jgi:hypothetical protein
MRGGDHGHQLRKAKSSRSPLRRAALGENLKNLFPINFAPVAHGEQVTNPFGTIEVVDHFDSRPRESGKQQFPSCDDASGCPTSFPTIDAGFDSGLDSGREFEEVSVEVA